MITTHATEVSLAATNINRDDWIDGAAELVMSGEYQYDRSTTKSKEAFISLDNVMEDVMGMDSIKDLLTKLLHGAECCDMRDIFSTAVRALIATHLSQMADDFNIGVR